MIPNSESAFVVVERPRGRFEVWEQCSDANCGVFHVLVAESASQPQAVRVRDALQELRDRLYQAAEDLGEMGVK